MRRVWYYFREADYDHIMNLWKIGDTMAQGASLMTDTTYTSRLLGSAWPGYFNKPIAEDMYGVISQESRPANLVRGRSKVTRPFPAARTQSFQRRDWPQRFQIYARPSRSTKTRVPASAQRAADLDDIGDVSWVVPTVTLSYPSNIPGGPGHNWANGISMATPIAHKGVVAGAKVQAMTMLDILLHPELVSGAWDYFNNVQNKTTKYRSFLRPGADRPAIWLNEKRRWRSIATR